MFIFVGCLLNEPLTSLEQNAKLEDKQQPADGRRFIWQQTTASISQVLLKISVCSAILESYRRERHCRVFDAGRQPRSPAQHNKKIL